MNSGRGPESEKVRFNLILQSEFPLNALVLASEALRIANQNTDQEHFEWFLVSEDGNPVRATNGMWIDVDCRIDDMPGADVHLLFEGNLPTQRNSRKLLGHIRSAARHGAVVGGIDTGAFAMFEAGVGRSGDESEIVLHWEAAQSFMERYPSAKPLNRLFMLRGREAHCAGGVATLDMVLELISRFRGEALANEVADALVHTRRADDTPQRGGGSAGKRAPGAPSSRLVRLMERNLEFPLTMGELATELRMSERTLSRHCKSAFGQSPMRLYLNVRLQAARNFLFYEEFSIKDVAMACGFSYAAVFSRVFKRQFGRTPREYRAILRKGQNSSVRPELRRMITRRRS